MTPNLSRSADVPAHAVDPEVVAARARARVGRVLCQKWRLESLLGVGGFGAVYAATHRTGSVVAVKVLHTHLAFKEVFRGRFLREAYAANKIRHPGVVTVLDDDTDEEDVPFLIMELLEGVTVEQRASHLDSRMDPREALWVADRLLDVLTAAHAQGVVHRDIKPQNVFITRDARLKVLDFGLARLTELSGAEGLSAIGVGMGTPSFTAPEQARGEWDLVDGRTDVFAVGATLFAVLAGRRLRWDRRGPEALVAAACEPAVPLASLLPSVHPQVAAVVDRALSFRQSDRFQSAVEMRDAVRAAYRACAGTALAEPEWNAGCDALGPVTRRASALPNTPIGGAGPFADELSSYDVDRSSVAEYPPEPPTQRIGVETPGDSERMVSRRELANGFVARGLSKHHAGDLQGAIADYTRAIDLVPVHAIAYFNRGVARQVQGNTGDALLDYGRAIDRQERFADPYYNRASILLARGELSRAAADAARALELYRAYGHELGVRATVTLAEAILEGEAATATRLPRPATP